MTAQISCSPPYIREPTAHLGQYTHNNRDEWILHEKTTLPLCGKAAGKNAELRGARSHSEASFLVIPSPPFNDWLDAVVRRVFSV